MAGLLLAAGCGEQAVEARVPDVARGAELYATWCAFCHGDSGEGYTADNANALANPEFLRVATDEFLRLATVHGRPGTPMSAWGRERGGPLDHDDVEDVVAFLRTWQHEPARDVHDEEVSGVATRGMPRYRALCAGCHGEDGEGVTAISLNNPWFHATASDGFLRASVIHGRPGTAMPAYGDLLTAQEIDDLVAAIRTWRRPVDDADVALDAEPDFANAILHPAGPSAEFELRDDRYVAADDVHAAMQAGERLVVLDARPPADFALSHITGALSLPWYDVERYVDELPPETWIVAYCGCPHAVSGQAVDALRAAGFERAVVLDEGFYVWEERGYPVTRPSAND